MGRLLILASIALALAAPNAEEVSRVVLNGEDRDANVQWTAAGEAVYFSAEPLAKALGFSMKKSGDLIILCAETACLPFGPDARHADDGSMISASALFTALQAKWSFDRETAVLRVDIEDYGVDPELGVDVVPGTIAPGFEVTLPDGKKLSSREYLGRKRLVVEFFRSGDW